MSSENPSNPVYFDLLKQIKVTEILPKRDVIVAFSNEKLIELLKKLAQKRILGAVVCDNSSDDSQQVLGFVDCFDVMVYLLKILEDKKIDLSTESTENTKIVAKEFADQLIGNVMNVSQANPYLVCGTETPLIELVRAFAKEAHRVAVKKGTSIINIVTPTDIIKFLAERGSSLGSNIVKPLKELTPFNSSTGIVTVDADEIASKAFLKMKNFKVNGAAVVDKNGRLVANLSATDLLGIDESSFHLLSLTTFGFLKAIYRFPKPPVYVSPKDTIEIVLLKMVVHKVHRVFIVDEAFKPISILTQTGLLKFLLAN